VTSRTPKARRRPAVRWFRDRVVAPLLSSISASANGPRPRAAWAGLGLVVLVVLTTFAVAWVSIWWVPAYLALMVLIFVTPHGRRRPAWTLKPGTESAGVVLTDLGNSVRLDRADEGDYYHLAAELVSRPTTGELTTESAGFSSDSASSGIGKARRGRGRTRKAAKTTAEPAPDAAPVTWIRVGPGKFVRGDANNQAVDQAQTEDVIGDVSPAMDVPVQVPLSSAAPVNALIEQGPLGPPEANFGDEGIPVACDDRVLGSVTEEYGIAPSAFSPIAPVSPSVEGLEHDVSGVAVTPEADLSPLANLGGNTLGHGVEAGRLGSPRQASGIRLGRVSRGIASAIRGMDRASVRRDVCTVPKPRALIWSSFAPNAHLRQAACRAFGRITHVQRALRPRSPPYR
jgi:hypothetical protein